MRSLLLIALSLPGCIIFDTSPASQRTRELTDDDADGVTLDEGDCNDFDPLVHPDAAEICDGLDNDCDDAVDEDGGGVVWCLDLDGDGHGGPASIGNACEIPANGVLVCDDCGDADSTVHPNATELCNGVDDDCDTITDEADALDAATWYPDADSDGYGTSGATIRACSAPLGYAWNADDCDDARAEVNPAAAEECNNGLDDNCDGSADPCGLSGTTDLDPEAVNPQDGGFVDGPDGVLESLGRSVYVADTLGDGTGDVILTGLGDMYGEREGGSLHLWYSPPLSEQTVDFASAHIFGPAGLEFAWYRGSVLTTDVDDDGSPELLVGAWGTAPGFSPAGQILRLESGMSGTREVSPEDIYVTGTSDAEAFGISLQSAEGLMDGMPSLLVSGPDYSDRVSFGGRVLVLGLPDADPAMPLASVYGTTASLQLGDRTPPPTDLNGDGTDDLILPTEAAAESGGVFLFYGPIGGEQGADDADAVITDPEYAAVGLDAIGFTDLTGDGRGDLLVESGGRFGATVLSVMILDGTQNGAVSMSLAANATLEPPGDSSSGFMVLERGDIDGDSDLDLLIGAPTGLSDAYGVDSGALYVLTAPIDYLGIQPISERADATFLGMTQGSALGLSVASGDTNGDGADDLLFHDDGTDVGPGGAWFLFGEGL